MGIKTIVLCLKYGLPAQKEQVLQIILSTDISLLCSLKFGPVLLKRILNYSGKSEPLKLVNQYFEKNFGALVKKHSHLEGLSIFLNSQSKAKHYQVLFANEKSLAYDEFQIKELLEFYQKSKNQTLFSIVHYAVLLNFALPN